MSNDFATVPVTRPITAGIGPINGMRNSTRVNPWTQKQSAVKNNVFAGSTQMSMNKKDSIKAIRPRNIEHGNSS